LTLTEEISVSHITSKIY